MLQSTVAPLLAAFSTFCLPTPALKMARKTIRRELTVRLSVNSYDPAQPRGSLTCLLKNVSRAAIFVPAEYGGRQLVIYGIGKTQ